LTKSIIFSHLYPCSVAPRKAPSSAKCNVHFRIPSNLKSFTKPRRLTSLQYEADMMLIILQMQITAQEYIQNHYINVAFFIILSPGNMLFSRMSPKMPVQNLISTCSQFPLLCCRHTKLRQTPMQNIGVPSFTLVCTL
jgi:hypothetical protein